VTEHIMSDGGGLGWIRKCVWVCFNLSLIASMLALVLGPDFSDGFQTIFSQDSVGVSFLRIG